MVWRAWIKYFGGGTKLIVSTKIIDSFCSHDGCYIWSLSGQNVPSSFCNGMCQWAYEKTFGSGTKLIVSSKGSSAPVKSEILKKQHENLITYVCLIEKFYPEVIRVTWTDGEKEITDNVGKGEAWKPAKEEEYSIGSWLTIPAENKNKNYYCKYEHESQQLSLPTKDSTETSQEEDCITYPGNGTVFNRDHIMHRTAYLVYIVLLLKSSMYYLIVLFFVYRMWASTKHQEKKA